MSLSGQQFNDKTLTGLSNTYSANIVCDNIEVTTSILLDTGGIITLPSQSIQDSALSINIPTKNGNNVFTNTNTFSNTTTINNQNMLKIQGSGTEYGRLQYVDGSHLFELQAMANSSIIRIKATTSAGATNIIMDFYSSGINVYKTLYCSPSIGLSNAAFVAFSDLTSQTTAYPGSSNFALLNANNTFTGVTNTFPTPLTTDNSTTVCTTAYVKNQNYITSSALTPYALLATSNAFTGATNTFVTPLTSDNSTNVATTAYVQSQNYLTSTALAPYALLATSNTFLGTANTMPTPATATNSTVVATTAFVKAQAYSPLAGTNAFTGVCTFNNAGPTIINQLAMPSSASQLFTVLNSGFVGAVQLSIPNATLPKFQVNSLGNVLACGTVYIPNNTAPLCTINSLGNINCTNMTSTTNIAIPNSLTPMFRCNSAGQIDYCNSIYIPNATTPTITLPNNGKITCVSIDGNSTTQITGDNTLKIATTAFVQSALPVLSNYALLNNGVATQTFTGKNVFTNNGTIDPIQITSSAMLYSTASLALNTTAGTYSSITQVNDFMVTNYNSVSGIGAVSICAATPTAGNVTGIRVDQNQVQIASGNGIQCLNPLMLTYNTSTYVAPTALQLGFQMYGVAFTNWMVTASTNIWSVTWDNTGNKLWGVYMVEIYIITTGSGSLLMSASFNEIGTTTFLSDKMAQSSGGTNLPAPYLGLKVVNMSFTLNIHVTTTYYLNTYCIWAGSNTAQTGSSYIKFTRIG